MKRRGLVLFFSTLLAVSASPASAQNLVDLLPMLLKQGAVIAKPASVLIPTQIDNSATDLSQSFVPAVTLTTVPQQLNAALALQLSTGTLGPTAPTVIYSRGGESGKMLQAFGGAYSDRGRTMGKGKIGLSLTFQNDEFTTLDGINLNDGGIDFLFANAGPSPDTSDVLQETVSYRINRKATSFIFNYGATNRLDLHAVVPIVQVAMDVRVQARLLRVRTPLDTLASCAGVPARNTGNGPALALCQDPHGFDTTLTLGTHDTYLALDIGTIPVFNNYGLQGKTARGIGDVQLGAKFAAISSETMALAATINFSLPSGNADNFLGSGAYRTTPGVAWSASTGRVSPHVSASYTLSNGTLSSTLATGTPSAPDLTVPDELNWAAGIDAAVAPRTTLVTDFFGRTVKNVQRFDTGTTKFASSIAGTNYSADAGAATDLILGSRGDLQQMFGTIGGRINLGGSIFANGTVKFPIAVDGLKARPTAAFWIDYAF